MIFNSISTRYLLFRFRWCTPKAGEYSIPRVCYSRVSGVLFTNDFFKVSSNKLTFMDLEEKLKDPICSVNRVCNGKVCIHVKTARRSVCIAWCAFWTSSHFANKIVLGVMSVSNRSNIARNPGGHFHWRPYQMLEGGKTRKRGIQIRVTRGTRKGCQQREKLDKRVSNSL